MRINAIDLPDLWFQATYNILKYGTRRTVDFGSYVGQQRIEYDWFTAKVRHPGTRPLLPQIPEALGLPNPVADDYLDDYMTYLMEDEVKSGETYTYGQRIKPQLQWVIDTYRGHGNVNNQVVIRVSEPDDRFLTDPPCLQLIDTAIRDGALEFFIYFRSWDLWAGLPANLAGIQMLKEYLAAEIGVKDGPMTVMSKSLHIYGYAEKLVNIRMRR
jgi:thymidylate synthase